HERALASAVRPQDPHEAARLHAQRDVRQHRVSRQADTQVIECKRFVHGCDGWAASLASMSESWPPTQVWKWLSSGMVSVTPTMATPCSWAIRRARLVKESSSWLL